MKQLAVTTAEMSDSEEQITPVPDVDLSWRLALMSVRRSHRGAEELDKMKRLSRGFHKAARETEQLYLAQSVGFKQQLQQLVHSRNALSLRNLVSLQQDFASDDEIQHDILVAIGQGMSALHAAKWVYVGSERPITYEKENDNLALALSQGKLAFTRQELQDMGLLLGMAQDAYIQAGGGFFQPDLSQLNAHDMAPVEVLHDLVLRIMSQGHGHQPREEICMCAFLLDSFYKSPYRETFPPGQESQHRAIAALKLLVLAMKQYSSNAQVQAIATEACVSICEHFGPGATTQLVSQVGGHHLIDTVFAAMRHFPMDFAVQLLALRIIVHDTSVAPSVSPPHQLASGHAGSAAQALPLLQPLHPHLVERRQSMYTGMFQRIEHIVRHHPPDLVPEKYVWRALEALILAKMPVLRAEDSAFCVMLFGRCIRTYHDTTALHYATRDAAMSAMLALLRAKKTTAPNSLLCDYAVFEHRAGIQRMLLALGIGSSEPAAAGSVRQHDAVISRVMSYCCRYATASSSGMSIPMLCRSLEAIGEMCKDNDEARRVFLFETNGIFSSLALAHVHRCGHWCKNAYVWASDDMAVVECLVDLLHAVYVRDCVCAEAVPPAILHTAGSTSFARQDTTKHTRHNTTEPRMLPVHSLTQNPSGQGAGCDGETVVEYLQLQMEQPGASRHLVKTCLSILCSCCTVDTNARLLHPGIILAAATPFFPGQQRHDNTPLQPSMPAGLSTHRLSSRESADSHDTIQSLTDTVLRQARSVSILA